MKNFWQGFEKRAGEGSGYAWSDDMKDYVNSGAKWRDWGSPEEFAKEMKERHAKGHTMSYMHGGDIQPYHPKEHNTMLEHLRNNWKTTQAHMFYEEPISPEERPEAEKSVREDRERAASIKAKLEKRDRNPIANFFRRRRFRRSGGN